MKIFCLALSGILLSANLCSADVREDLQGLNREIKKKRLLLRRSNKVEAKVSGELQHIENSLKEKQDALRTLQRDMQKVERNLQSIAKEMARVQDEVDRRKLLINQRIRALYKAGDISTVRMMFTAESFPQLSENLQYTKSVLAHDRRLVEEYLKKIEELRQLKVQLDTEASRKGKIKKEVEVKAQEIEEEKSRKTTYLHKIREDKKTHMSSLKELQANARRLQSMIEKLEARGRKSYSAKPDAATSVDVGRGLPSVPDKGFSAQKGRLSFPAKGAVTGRFGRHKHPEFNSFTVSNGLTIAAAQGADIHSVFDGQVIFADYFKGYGNMVIIDHGGGYFSLYGHASKIHKKVGANVARNDLIAVVGDADSSDGAKLYFEIRFQGKPVDPMPWFH